MQSEIEGMAAWESYEPFEGRLRAESKIACQEEVADKADKIACDIGDIGYRPEQEHVIDAVMDGWWEHSI